MGDNYQLAMVGSGSGGCGATCLAARNDFRAALIERDRIGGAYCHSGCYAVGTLQASRSPAIHAAWFELLGLFGVLEMSKLESPEWFRCGQPGCNLRALSTRTHNEQSELAAGEPNRPGETRGHPNVLPMDATLEIGGEKFSVERGLFDMLPDHRNNPRE